MRSTSETKTQDFLTLSTSPKKIFLIFDGPNEKAAKINQDDLKNAYGEAASFIFVDADDFLYGRLRENKKEKYAALKDPNVAEIILVGHCNYGELALRSNKGIYPPQTISGATNRSFSVRTIALLIKESPAKRVRIMACRAGEEIKGSSFAKSLYESFCATRTIVAPRTIVFQDQRTLQETTYATSYVKFLRNFYMPILAAGDYLGVKLTAAFAAIMLFERWLCTPNTPKTIYTAVSHTAIGLQLKTSGSNLVSQSVKNEAKVVTPRAPVATPSVAPTDSTPSVALTVKKTSI